MQGETERARELYETWKDKPVESKEKDPKLFAKAILEDFEQFEREGLLEGIKDVPIIRASMEAVLAAR